MAMTAGMNHMGLAVRDLQKNDLVLRRRFGLARIRTRRQLPTYCSVRWQRTTHALAGGHVRGNRGVRSPQECWFAPCRARGV